MRILTSAHYYFPGFKAGGPIRTLTNLVEQLGQEFSVYIVTSDRDFGDQEPYQEVDLSGWNRVGKAGVRYVAHDFLWPFRLAVLFARTPHEVLYLNSLFDPAFTLLPLIMRRLRIGPNTSIVLAPRGELSAGALALQKTKKVIFLRAARWLRLYRDVIWQASSEYEAADIRAWMGNDAQIMVAPNLPSASGNVCKSGANTRHQGRPLKLLFLSRIAPKKNLDFALRVLKSVGVPVDFSIYGPHQDQAYLKRCRQLAALLPQHITVRWYGPVHPEQVADVFAQQDLFFFPTRGENYGHVIAEALSAGTPVLISDQTPWRDLESAGVGWDLPLDDEAAFVKCIEQCAHILPVGYDTWRKQVVSYAHTKLAANEILEANRRLFLCAAGKAVSSPACEW